MRDRIVTSFVVMLLIASAGAGQDEPTDSSPTEFAPFEHLVGGWKGQGIPTKNRLKGWPEKHNWAWKFVKGKPVGMTLETTGSKIIASAKLTPGSKDGGYRLEGTDPEGKAIVFLGKMDESGVLRLDRLDAPVEVGKERLDIALNQNKIRYTMRLFRQEPGSPQFASTIEANLGKEGESFAAGGASADLPKCIVTGGAGSMTVSFQGKAYPICCSGCRDEFTENPEKYVKKYLARIEKGEAKPAPTEAAPEAPAKSTASSKAMPKAPAAKAKVDSTPAKSESKTPDAKDDTKVKAASLLSQAAALEKAGKTQAAMTYYRRVVKEYPDTASAKSAAAKLRATEKK